MRLILTFWPINISKMLPIIFKHENLLVVQLALCFLISKIHSWKFRLIVDNDIFISDASALQGKGTQLKSLLVNHLSFFSELTPLATHNMF